MLHQLCALQMFLSWPRGKRNCKESACFTVMSLCIILNQAISQSFEV